MGGKAHDVKVQQRTWDKLLEGRMALQKVVVASRELSSDHKVEEETEKGITKLLKCLVLLRETYRNKSQLQQEADSSSSLLDVEVDDEFLEKRHEKYSKIRDETIEKWCEKTKIGTIPKKGYVALELPTLQLISNSLRDKERLIRRTQLDRTSHVDDDYKAETFNDDDFYHQLLKEMISKDDSRKWIDLQRARYKQKRKAETRATKGRKIRKDLIPKLVNFMAPMRPAHLDRSETPMPEQIRNELLKSLFGGGGAKSSSPARARKFATQESEESEDDDDEITAESD